MLSFIACRARERRWIGDTGEGSEDRARWDVDSSRMAWWRAGEERMAGCQIVWRTELFARGGIVGATLVRSVTSSVMRNLGSWKGGGIHTILHYQGNGRLPFRWIQVVGVDVQ